LVLTIRDFGKLGVNRAWAERGYGNPATTRFGANRFGKTGDIGFCRGVNSNVAQREKTGGRTDVQNRAAVLCDHAWKERAS
jgi:hypothetical protein